MIMNWKRLLALLLLGPSILLILFYLFSPYQNCLRSDQKIDSQNIQAKINYCMRNTNW